MTLEYSYSYYSKLIMKFLVLNKDKAYSMGEVHNELLKKYPDMPFTEINIKRFKQAFFTIENDYENIYRFVTNNRQYLVWSLKEKSEIKREYGNISQNIENTHRDIETVNYIEIIEDFLKEKKYEYITSNNYLDGSNNAIHILIKNNKKDQLEELDKYHKIDWNNKNILGQTCLDIAKNTKNMDMIEYILKNIYEGVIKELKTVIDKQKDIQKEILDSKTELSKNYDIIQKNNKELNDYIFNLYIGLLILTIALLMAIGKAFSSIE